MAGRRYDRRHYRVKPYDQDYSENRDLERGTIFDRSQNRQGNYNLTDDYEGFNDQSGNFSRIQQGNFYPSRYNQRNYGQRDVDLENFGSMGQTQPNFELLGYDIMADLDTPGWVYTEYWWEEPGPFTGVGPKGYQRSDDRIFDEVCDLLSRHGQLDASQMDVAVKDGEVTLSGQVDSRRSKRIAESLAESVPGVVDVNNRLTFQHGRAGGQKPSRQPADQNQGQRSFNREGGPMEENYREQHPQDNRFHTGMDVMGSDGKYIGQVREIHPHDLLVDRENTRDTYVPKDAVQDIRGNQLVLTVASDQVDSMQWHNPHEIEIPNRDTR